MSAAASLPHTSCTTCWNTSTCNCYCSQAQPKQLLPFPIAHLLPVVSHFSANATSHRLNQRSCFLSQPLLFSLLYHIGLQMLPLTSSIQAAACFIDPSSSPCGHIHLQQLLLTGSFTCRLQQLLAAHALTFFVALVAKKMCTSDLWVSREAALAKLSPSWVPQNQQQNK